MIRHFACVFMSLALLLALRCSNAPTVATGGTDGPNFLTGSLRTPGGVTPVENALVVLYSQPKVDLGNTLRSLPVQTSLGVLTPLDSTRTDSAGRYSFIIDHPGTFRIYARSPDSLFVVTRTDIIIDGTGAASEADTMTLPLTLKGNVPAGLGFPVRIIFPGTPFSTMADSAGGFTLDLLPQGIYTVVVVIDNPGLDRRGVIFTDTLRIDSAHPTIDLGTLTVPAIGGNQTVIDFDSFDSAQMQNSVHGLWWVGTKNAVATPTPLLFDSLNSNGTLRCARLSYAVTDTPAVAQVGVNMGAHLHPWELKEVRDFSRVDSMSFWLQGSGGAMSIVFHSALVDQWNDFCYRIPFTPGTWTKTTIRFPQDVRHLFTNAPQKNWDDLSRAIMFISFGADSIAAGEQNSFAVDDIVLYKH